MSSCDLIGANAVLAAHEKPHGGEPLVETDGRVLENRADLEREFLLGMSAITAIEPRLFEIGDFLDTTSRAADLAIGPADSDHELAAILVFAEELDRLLECFWAFHVAKMAN